MDFNGAQAAGKVMAKARDYYWQSLLPASHSAGKAGHGPDLEAQLPVTMAVTVH